LRPVHDLGPWPPDLPKQLLGPKCVAQFLGPKGEMVRFCLSILEVSKAQRFIPGFCVPSSI
jgi:hypothetical protein